MTLSIKKLIQKIFSLNLDKTQKLLRRCIRLYHKLESLEDDEVVIHIK